MTRPSAPVSAAGAVALRTLLTLLALTACGGGGGDGAITPPPTITAVSVSPSSVALQGVGASATLSAALSPSSATGAIAWQTSNPSVATVSGSGASATVVAVGGGSTTVIASAGGVSGSTTVTVTPIVRSITPSRTSAALLVGGATTLSATLGADPGAASGLTWTTSAAAVATVDANGLVTAVAPGSATITVASAAFPSVSATIAVTVAFPLVRSVSVSPSSPAVVSGQTRQLTATVDVDAGTATTVTWSSATPAVATVSATGLVSAVSSGTAVVRATSTANPTVSGTATVTVTSPTVRAITISPAAPAAPVGATQQFALTFDADVGASTAVTWSSSNPAVATVNASGLVSTVSVGTSVIRATSTLVPAISAQATITVTPPPALTNWTLRSITPAPLVPTGDALQSWSMTNSLAFFLTVGSDGDRTVNKFDGVAWTAQTLAPFDNLSAIGGTGGLTFIGNRSGRMAQYTVFNALQPTFSEFAIPSVGCIKVIRPAGSGAVVLANAVASSTNCFSVTAIVVYNGSTWTRIQNPTALTSVTDIVASSPTDIVAVGVGGTGVQRWNGSAWTSITAPPALGIPQSVAFLGSDIVATLGANGAARFNGSSWTAITAPAPRPNNGITLTGVTTCGGQLYVGSTFDGRVFRLDNTAWTELASFGVAVPGTYTTTVQCGADNTVRVLGADGGVGRLNGSAWAWETYSPWMFRAVALRSDLAWITGGHGVVEKWDGVRWTIDLSTSSFGFMDKLTATTDGMVIAGGQGSPLGLWRKSGATWVFDAMANTPLAVWASSQTMALSLNQSNTALKWDGSAWQTIAAPSAFTAFSIDGTSPSFALAVGSATSGGAGKSFRWDGTAFSEVTVPGGSTTLLAVDAVSPTLAYAVTNSAVLQFNGTQWQAVTGLNANASELPLRSVAANSSSDVYVLGSTGAVFHYDGTSWSRVALLPSIAGVSPYYQTISLAPDGSAIIAGYAGQIYHATPSASARATLRGNTRTNSAMKRLRNE